jgi:hypothetical protein
MPTLTKRIIGQSFFFEKKIVFIQISFCWRIYSLLALKNSKKKKKKNHFFRKKKSVFPKKKFQKIALFSQKIGS